MSIRLLQHTTDACDMLDGKAEHHEIHPCLRHDVVVFKVMLNDLPKKKRKKKKIKRNKEKKRKKN